MGITDLVKVAKEQREKNVITGDSTYVEKLKAKLTQRSNLTNQECLDLQKEVNDFMRSNVSEEDKKMISGYTESLHMICSAIKEKKL